MHPELFHVGVLHLRSFGFMMAVAFLFGTWLGLREAKRLGLDEDRLVNVILITLIASVIGARGLYVLEHLAEFRRSWGSVFALWEGGLTLYGGIVAGTFAGLVAAKRMGLSPWRTADALAPSLAIGVAFGRVGCFLNGCCYGRPTSLPIGVRFPPGSFAALEFGDQPVHPSQLYNSAAALVLFAVLWWARRRVRTAGVLFWSFVALFAIVRILIDFTRSYEAEAVVLRGAVPVTESQATSFVLALFAAMMIVRLQRGDERARA